MVPDYEEFVVDQMRFIQLTLNRHFYLQIAITVMMALILWRMW